MNDTSLVHVRDTNAPPPPTPLSPREIAEFLDYAGTQLKDRRAEVTAALDANIAAHPEIEDDEVLATIAENMRLAAALGRTAEERRVQHKDPFLEGGRVVDGWFKRFRAPLDKAMAPVQAAMDAYGARKLARQQAEAEAQRKSAQAEADRAIARASEALRQGGSASAALDLAADAALRAEEAEERTHARPADLTRTYSDFGAVASVRQKWKWRVVNAAAVPREYLMIDDDLVKVAAKKRDSAGKPVVMIPGIEFYAETKMGVR
jgi:hypothetical protein